MIDLDRYYRVYVAIHLDAVYQNVINLKQKLRPGTKVIAVIKTDGYGHGAVPVAETIDSLVDAYAVATIDEALNLRRHQLTKPIYVIGYTHPGRYEDAVREQIRITIYNYEDAMRFGQCAGRLGQTGYVHIKVDTGMSRIGFLDNDESVDVIEKISCLKNIETEGIFTHFATADEADKSKAYSQFCRFQEFVEKCEAKGVHFSVKHCSNSAAMMEMPEANMDAVRAGIAMYGLYPSDEMQQDNIVLTPVLEMKSHIIHLKELPVGTEISYGGTFITKKPTMVATIPVGYGDGYRRSLSNRGKVLIRGMEAPILGRVCMDQFMVDVTDIPDVCVGDLVTLIGKDGNHRITVEELARMAGETFHYEIVCDLGKRIPRVFYRDGQIIGTKDYFEDTYDMML